MLNPDGVKYKRQSFNLLEIFRNTVKNYVCVVAVNFILNLFIFNRWIFIFWGQISCVQRPGHSFPVGAVRHTDRVHDVLADVVDASVGRPRHDGGWHAVLRLLHRSSVPSDVPHHDTGGGAAGAGGSAPVGSQVHLPHSRQYIHVTLDIAGTSLKWVYLHYSDHWSHVKPGPHWRNSHVASRLRKSR